MHWMFHNIGSLDRPVVLNPEADQTGFGRLDRASVQVFGLISPSDLDSTGIFLLVHVLVFVLMKRHVPKLARWLDK